MKSRRFRYTGKERDDESGLQAHGVRMYAPWLGRWMSADPIGLGDGLNRHLYVHANPVRGRDPSGTETRAEQEQRIAQNWNVFRETADARLAERWGSWVDASAWAESGANAVEMAGRLAETPLGQQAKYVASGGLSTAPNPLDVAKQGLGIAADAAVAAVSTPLYHPLQDMGAIYEGGVGDARQAGIRQGDSQYELQLNTAVELATAGAGHGGGLLRAGRYADGIPVPRAGVTTELYSRRPSFPAMAPERFERIKTAFERQGRFIDVTDDAVRYLDLREAEGLTFNADTILLRPGASPSTVFEELIHATQHRTGQFDDWVGLYGNAGAEAMAEYRAAQKLVRAQKAYGISDAEHAINVNRVEAFGRQLDEMGIQR